MNMKITCECGKTFSRANKLRHEKSQKHQAYLNDLVSDSDSDSD